MRPRPSRIVTRTFVWRLTRKPTVTLRPERLGRSPVARVRRTDVRELALVTEICGGTAGCGPALGPLAAAPDCAATPGPGGGATGSGAGPPGRVARQAPPPGGAGEGRGGARAIDSPDTAPDRRAPPALRPLARAP